MVNNNNNSSDVDPDPQHFMNPGLVPDTVPIDFKTSLKVKKTLIFFK